MIESGIRVQEYVARRGRLLRALRGRVGLVLAGSGGSALLGRWRADSDFFYLTGIADEPGASLLLDPKAEDPRRRCVLFLKPRDPELERWDGFRDPIGQRLKTQTGFESIMRTGSLGRMLLMAARRSKALACLHPFASHDRPVSGDLEIFRKVASRVVGAQISDATDLIPRMRAVKSAGELRLMRRAIRATAAGFDAALEVIAPGARERDIQRAIERAFEDNGASGPAYNTIVGSGVRGTVLHYMANAAQAEDGDLLVIDAGAYVGHYAADVTRTYPVSGRFTKEQSALYTTVLKAQAAAIRAVRPGATLVDIDRAARRVIDQAGHADAFMHGIGHHLGLEVHDATPDGKLEPGMVLTIEPGIYLEDRRIGIRIEDDVLVTHDGRRNLTSAIGKSIQEIESAIALARRRHRRTRG